jgi:molybdopterin converting factor small subunit
MAGDRSDHRTDGGTVRESLQALCDMHPGISGWILDERGAIRRHINVFVNGEYAEEDTPVRDDDRIDVLPAISGG